MKIQRYIKQFLFLAAVSLLSARVMAQQQTIPVSGEWNAMTVTTNQTVSLTGDIQVKGPITIGDGSGTTVNVTIKNGKGSKITVKNESDNTGKGAIFKLRKGCKLTIEGTAGGEVVFDGGASFFTSEEVNYNYKLTAKSDSVVCDSSMFQTNGDLTLKHVIIQDFYTKKNDESAIKIAAYNEKCGKTNLDSCTIQRCQAPYGSAIYCHGNQEHTDNNKAEDLAIALTSTNIQQCICTLNRKQDGGISDYWGGAIRFRGKCKSSLTMTNCTMQENYSQGDGSCIWWNAGGAIGSEYPILTLDGCKFTKNRAARDAGALRLEGTFSFSGSPTVFSENACGRYGGAIQVAGYQAGAGSFTAVECFYHFSNVQISQNKAGVRGGGISAYFPEDSNQPDNCKFEIYIEEGTQIHNNTAGNHGGGISLMNETKPEKKYTFHIYLDAADIYENEASDGLGGGIYAENSNISYQEKSAKTVSIYNNKAIGEKTAKSGGGGISLQHGEMHLKTANITGNNAKSENGNGGGIRLEDGSFSLESGSISNNTAYGYGGGVFVYNSTDNQETVTLSGGSITGNEAKKAGGGIAVYGYITFNVTGIDISSNTARNGGGIFLHGDTIDKKTEMTYSSGVIRGNKAGRSGELTDKTAYDKEENEVSGMGGGIYAGIYSTMNLSAEGGEGEIGVYENIADNGADDIFSAGKAVSDVPLVTITVPNVSEMTLSGFEEGGEHQLFWVEDYPTDDPNYDKGTYEKGSTGNVRYRDTQHGEGVYEVDFSGKDTTLTKYVCLTLGWRSSFITIVKEGLEDKDNAIFKIYEGAEEKEESLFMTVILTDKDKGDDGKRRKTIKVDDGTWTVKETPWSWAYETTLEGGENTRELGPNSTPEERTFTFKNTPKEGDIPHSESVKTNELDPSSSPQP